MTARTWSILQFHWASAPRESVREADSDRNWGLAINEPAVVRSEEEWLRGAPSAQQSIERPRTMKSDSMRWTRDFLGKKCPCGSGNIADTCCWKGDGCWEKTPVGELVVKETTIVNPSCYLSRMSNCSAAISREHIISRNILEKITNDTLRFDNAAHFFGGKNQVEIGMDSFVSKVLCTIHNSALSPLDKAAGAAFQRIEELTKDMVSVLEKGYNLNSFHVASGIDLERWMIKVFCGLVAARKIRSASGCIVQPSCLPPELLEALMGATILKSPLGLYMHSFPGQIRKSGLSFGTIMLSDGSDQVGGLILSLGIINVVLVTSHRYAQTFNEPSWYRHQTLVYNIKHESSRLRFLFTY